MESIDIETIYKVLGKISMEKELLIAEINRLRDQLNQREAEIQRLRKEQENKEGTVG